MAFRAMIDKVHTYFAPEKKQSPNPYVFYACATVGAIAFVAAGVGGYRWYRTYQEQKAQEVFSSCMREYERAEQDPTLWPNAELVFRLALEQNPNATLTPSLLAFQAEALLHMNKPEQALACMKQAVAMMPPSSLLLNLYTTKCALMMMDSSDAAIQQEGLTSLTTLAYNKANSSRDMALYFLGLYHWSHDTLDKARDTWSELLPLAAAEPASPWAQRAVAKLEQIGV